MFAKRAAGYKPGISSINQLLNPFGRNAMKIPMVSLIILMFFHVYVHIPIRLR
jgi:hypothetical protein